MESTTRSNKSREDGRQTVHIPMFFSHMYTIISRGCLGSHDGAHSLRTEIACDAQSCYDSHQGYGFLRDIRCTDLLGGGVRSF